MFIEKVKMTISYQEEIKFISNKIRELRKEKQMTVQELAYRCDMERSNMSRIESGRTNLTVKTMCIICNALNVNLRDIIR
ncbi:helix-turn-helix domain-containing protein [Alistipes putredinis]|uniref:helix-turn-helix domain-containing protein n=1 Tax=Alistipes putredinis TaxID=28117 RepID=UPI003AB63DC0